MAYTWSSAMDADTLIEIGFALAMTAIPAVGVVVVLLFRGAA